MLNTLVPMLGIGMVLLVAWGLSENRRAVPWRTVIGGMALQLALALVLIGFPPATRAVLALNDAVHALQTATDAGTRFVFGYLGGPPYPFSEPFPGAAFILAFKALPLVLVISALATLLFHGACSRQSHAPSPGSSAAPWASAEPWASAPPRMSSSA